LQSFGPEVLAACERTLSSNVVIPPELNSRVESLVLANTNRLKYNVVLLASYFAGMLPALA
jgi:hypothetical protein